MIKYFFLSGESVPESVVKFSRGSATAFYDANCSRCGGRGNYHNFGACYLCGGSGKHGGRFLKVFTAEALPGAIAKAEFAAAVKEAKRVAKIEASVAEKAAKAVAFRAANPVLAAGLAKYAGSNNFLRSLNGKIDSWGDISENAVAAGLKAIERIEAEVLAKAAAPDVPEGAVVISGEVIGIKFVAGFGYNAPDVKKLVIKDAKGFKVYGTAPSIPGEWISIERGDVIEFKATVEASKDDPKLGFYKRPRLAKFISRVCDKEKAELASLRGSISSLASDEERARWNENIAKLEAEIAKYAPG